ncbi:MAG TPA: hypothetical protein DCZ83_01815 [Candidatus Yonathbacteria bacterium]|nr:hypothetical protein [Candidatus Yonathbacteria bacterium]
MNKQYKKIFSVLFAILVGASIVFLAWKGGDVAPTDNPSLGSNKWKDALVVIPQTYTSKTLGSTKGDIEMSTEEATTTTDVVARKLLLEYATSQAGVTTAEISDADAQSIANTLAQEVKLPHKKNYVLGDLNVSLDNSYDANLLYINTLSARLNKYVATGQKETDLTILLSAMTTRSTTTLGKLKEKEAIYQDLIKDLLAIKTPSRITQLHLRLIQDYETLRSSIVGLQSMLIDPVVGIAALAEYRVGFDDLFLTEKAYREFNFAN